ncbi:MAG: P1 family peptidase, partial [Gemmatimonadales bacterium]
MRLTRLLSSTAIVAWLLLPCALVAQAKPRARDLGVPFEGTTGPLNAITDVAGVEVGQVTLISGEGKLIVGKGPVRTGVTAVFPRGRDNPDPVFAAWSPLNGNGEMTGTAWVEESGFLTGPVTITNTLSVGTVRDAVIAWALGRQYLAYDWGLPVTAETEDEPLNDLDGFHVTRADVFRALDSARGGPVAEGNVGGGTGMVCYEFKGGIGTASRRLSAEEGGYMVGVLVQCNNGYRNRLTIAGVPVGQEIPDLLPCYTLRPTSREPTEYGMCPGGGQSEGPAAGRPRERGSIIVVVATDAPLLPSELKRVARRAGLGIGRTGATGGNGSGDIFL